MTQLPKIQAHAFITEDAPKGDITTEAIFGHKPQTSKAIILAKQELVISGLAAATNFLRHEFPKVKISCVKNDGQRVKTKTIIANLTGPVADLLKAERVILNLLQRLSGIATLTAACVKIAGPKGPKILDTRKTTPGLRLLEKAAVLHGGGHNHRQSLSDMYLIKDNHIAAAGSVHLALTRVLEHRRKNRLNALIEVEVTTLTELAEAIALSPDIILLDNMSPKLIERAVHFCKSIESRTGKKGPLLEISGGVTLQNLPRYVKLGIDRISLGSLTHSAPAVDLSMRIVPQVTSL